MYQSTPWYNWLMGLATLARIIHTSYRAGLQPVRNARKQYNSAPLVYRALTGYGVPSRWL